MNTLLIVGLGVAGVGVIMYNRMVALRQTAKNAFADIDVQLKQRQDLIPNLVETVKRYAAHESGVLTAVTQARASAMGATSINDKMAAEATLSRSLTGLFAVAENYPDLKANQNFLKLQDDLGDIENKIAAARRFFNNAVAEFNTAISQFPNVLFAGILGFTAMQPFALDDAERAEAKNAPKVSFGG